MATRPVFSSTCNFQPGEKYEALCSLHLIFQGEIARDKRSIRGQMKDIRAAGGTLGMEQGSLRTGGM